MTQRNDPARKAMLAARRIEQEGRTGRTERAGAKRSLSKRGEVGRPWLTKKRTLARKQSMEENRNDRIAATATNRKAAS